MSATTFGDNEKKPLLPSWTWTVLGWLIPALLSSSLAFGVSYVNTRETIKDTQNDINHIKNELEERKQDQNVFVRKDAQTETNRALLESVNELKGDVRGIRNMQIEVLNRLADRQRDALRDPYPR